MLDFEKPITDLENKINELRSVENDGHLNLVDEINVLQQKCNKLIAEIYNDPEIQKYSIRDTQPSESDASSGNIG